MRGSNPAAAIVTAHNNVPYFQNIHRILNYRKTIEVGMDNHISHISVNKELARSEAYNFIGGNSAIGAANP
jgi:hypothetical protein